MKTMTFLAHQLYSNKEWLEDQYINCKKSTREIGRELDVDHATISNWLKKHKITMRTLSEVQKLNKSKPEIRRKISESRMGEKNWNWKGDKVSYRPLHQWIEHHKPKPEVCEICGKSGRIELSCKDHNYNRHIDNYQYLCCKCHRQYDKENKLRK